MNDNCSILLVNPWIHDFAAYDLWSKPLGLLQIGGMLRKYGYHVQLLDCLDRYHPALLEQSHLPKSKPDGTGKYLRQIIDKPKVLEHIPRQFARYGMPYELVLEQLKQLPRQPDLIFLTSIMTYWYTGVQEMCQLLKLIFPDTPVVLGGIYARLCRQHAAEHIDPDYLFTGSTEAELTRLLSSVPGMPDVSTHNQSGKANCVPWDLYPDLRTLAVMTSRGCPNHCEFCASHALTGGYSRYGPDVIFQNIAFWHERTGLQHVAFYDDALLHQAECNIIPLLTRIIEAKLPVKLHTPNGLQPRFVDQYFADLFAAAGGHTVRLSFESSNPERLPDMSYKVTGVELRNAVQCLNRTGIPCNQIGVYILLGLPGQPMQEVEDSIDFVANLGVKINLASFSPIPGTRAWTRLLEQGLWSVTDDLLLTNTTIFPLWSRQFGYTNVESFVRQLKQRIADITNNITFHP